MSENFPSRYDLNDGLLARFLLEKDRSATTSRDSYAYAESFAVEYKDLLGKSLRGPAAVADMATVGVDAQLGFDASHDGVYVWQIDGGSERIDLIAGSAGYVFATKYQLTSQGTVQRRESVHDTATLDGIQSAVFGTVESAAFMENVAALREQITTLRQEYARAMAARVLRSPEWEKTALFRKTDDADDAANKLFHAGFAAGSLSKRTVRPLLYAADWRPAPIYDAKQ